MQRMVSDIGGLPAGEIPQEDVPQLFWQKQLMALYFELQGHKILVSDEFRRKVEEMAPDAYAASDFYGRRLDAIAGLLVEKGVIDGGELETRADAILKSGTRDHVA